MEKESTFKGVDKSKGEFEFNVTESSITVTFKDGTNVTLSYSEIISFAMKEKENMLVIEYEENEDNSELLMLHFNKDKKVKLIYEMINEYNKNINKEEFDTEPEGENELYTAESFK